MKRITNTGTVYKTPALQIHPEEQFIQKEVYERLKVTDSLIESISTCIFSDFGRFANISVSI